MENDDPLEALSDTERRIGRNLRRIREGLKLTQGDIASRLKAQGLRFHQSQVAKIERGERPLRVNEWIAIAEALGVSSEALMAGGPETDDDLFEAKLMYERCRQIVDDAGVRLHEAGSFYEQALLQFYDVRERYREVAIEHGVEPDEPKFLLVHEAAERLAKMGATRDYAQPALEVLDEKRERDAYEEAPMMGERYLRDRTG